MLMSQTQVLGRVFCPVVPYTKQEDFQSGIFLFLVLLTVESFCYKPMCHDALLFLEAFI